MSARIDPEPLDRFVAVVTAGPMTWAHCVRPGQACHFDVIVPRAELVKTDFFNDAIRPMGGYHSVVAIPLRQDGFDSFVAVCRPERSDDFEDHDASVLARIVPHVTRALRTRLHVDSAEARAMAALGAFDQLDIAVAIVDRDLRPVAVNRHADRILTQGDGLRRTRGALSAVGAADGERLRRARGPRGGRRCTCSAALYDAAAPRHNRGRPGRCRCSGSRARRECRALRSSRC